MASKQRVQPVHAHAGRNRRCPSLPLPQWPKQAAEEWGPWFVVGLFAAKCAPTATADPYGLRRSAVGMLQVRASRAMGQGPVHLPAAACAVGHAVLTGGGVAHAPPPFSKRLALS